MKRATTTELLIGGWGCIISAKLNFMTGDTILGIILGAIGILLIIGYTFND